MLTFALLELTAEEHEKLMLPVNGSGGFQGLLRKIQDNVTPAGQLTVTGSMLKDIKRYVNEYGRGGFQGRIQTVLTTFNIRPE